MSEVQAQAQIIDFIEPYVRREVQYAMSDVCEEFDGTPVTTANMKKISRTLKKYLEHLTPTVDTIKFGNTSFTATVSVKLRTGVEFAYKLTLYEEAEEGFDFLINEVK